MTVVPNDDNALIQETFQNGSTDQCEENKKSEVEAEIVIGVDELENGLFPKPEGETLLSATETKSCQANVNVNDKEKEEDMFELENDIYSIMYIAPIDSRCLWWSLLVCATQLFILSLAIIDMKKDAPYNNKFKIPIDVNWQVASAQFVAIVVITLLQNDVFTSLDALIVVGYHASVAEQFPAANLAKWIISNILRMVVGVLNLLAAFFIIIQADDVLDIFKDFAALHFITELDNAAFWLADVGYLGASMNSAANDIKNIRLPHSRRRMKWMVWSAITALLVVMLSGICTVRSRQMSGYFLKNQSTQNFTIVFGDEVYKLPNNTEFNFDGATRELSNFNKTDPPFLYYEFFSGSYQLSSNGDKPEMYNRRPIYYERNATKCKTDPTCGMFYYCSYVGAWVFTIRALNNATKQLGPDECRWGWLALSAKTEAHKLEDVPTTGWKIWTGVMKETDTLSIISDSDACQGPQDCGFNGHCVRGKCVCYGDWKGKKCEIESYCPALWLIHYGESSYEYYQDGPFFLLTYKESAAMTSYGRPMYVNMWGGERCINGPAFSAVLYTGRRWFFSIFCKDGYLDEKGKFTEKGNSFFGEDFHAYWDNILNDFTYWFSEPSSSESPGGLDMFEFGYEGTDVALSNNPLALLKFECMDLACQRDRSVCGEFGTCTERTYDDRGINIRFHNCSCTEFDGGPFCRLPLFDSYVADQYDAWYAFFFKKNGTDYVPNEYHNLFWKDYIEDVNAGKYGELW